MKHKKFINIGLIPSIKETYKNHFEFSFDLRIYNLLGKIFLDYKIHLIKEVKDLKNIQYVIFSGGNDLIKFNKTKKNIIRNKIDLNILQACLKKKIKILGICYGSQFISNYFRSKLIKKKHVGSHNVIIINNNSKINIKVNSFHNYVIKKLGPDLIPLAIANDKSIEAFKHKNKKILGIMWHPERYKKIKKVDVNLIKKVLCN